MDGRGVPLSIIVTAANVNDGKRIEEVLLAIVVKRKRTPLRRSKHLCADAGYRSAEALRIIDSHGYIPHVVDRRQEAAAKQRQPRSNRLGTVRYGTGSPLTTALRSSRAGVRRSKSVRDCRAMRATSKRAISRPK